MAKATNGGMRLIRVAIFRRASIASILHQELWIADICTRKVNLALCGLTYLRMHAGKRPASVFFYNPRQPTRESLIFARYQLSIDRRITSR